MFGRILFWLLVATCLVLAPASDAWAASGKDKKEATKLTKAAKKHVKSENWQEARDALQEAIDLHDSAGRRLLIAKAEEKMGHLLEAREHLEKIKDIKKKTWWHKANSKKKLKKINAAIPKLTIMVPEGFSGTVKLDDKELSSSELGEAMEVNPGPKSVVAEAEGFATFEEQLVLAEGETQTLDVKMEKPEPAEAAPAAAKKGEEEEEDEPGDGSTYKTIGYVSLAVGGVGLAVGGIFGMMARGTRNDLRDECVDDLCTESQRETFDKGKSQANISTAGFIVGGVGIGLGVVLLLTAPSGGPSSMEMDAGTAKITPYVGPMSLGVEGTF